MLFNDTMTVYNHYVENDTDKWQRTVVKGVMWSHSKMETSVSGGMQTLTRVETVTIPQESALNYEAPVLFRNEKFRRKYWTLDTSDKMDVVVFGVCTTEVQDEKQLKNLFKENQYVGTVSDVSDNRNRTFLKSIKVVLK